MLKNESHEDAKIILVEDDEELSQLMTIAIKKYGYAIQCCFNADDALKMLCETDEKSEFYFPDLIIIDIGLPDMKGFELVAILTNKRPKLAKIPFIFTTAQYMEKDDIIEGLNLGAYDYLLKPFDMDILLLKIKNCIHFYKTIMTRKSSFDAHEILDIKETADFLRLTEKTVYTLVKEGKIPSLKIGGQWRF